eukprot:GHVU01069944.1.p1 GENE.GHVU01069944.1~~GHVU01069944.1.p1  ORF type:complete len:103 (+),score=6.67 GHVU01069944.1:151-459(+)
MMICVCVCVCVVSDVQPGHPFSTFAGSSPRVQGPFAKLVWPRGADGVVQRTSGCRLGETVVDEGKSERRRQCFSFGFLLGQRPPPVCGESLTMAVLSTACCE